VGTKGDLPRLSWPRAEGRLGESLHPSVTTAGPSWANTAFPVGVVMVEWNIGNGGSSYPPKARRGVGGPLLPSRPRPAGPVGVGIMSKDHDVPAIRITFNSDCYSLPAPEPPDQDEIRRQKEFNEALAREHAADARTVQREIAADPLPPAESAVLGTLRKLVAEIEELRRRPNANPWDRPTLRREILISQIPGIRDLSTYCNIKLLQYVTTKALDRVARRLVRRLKEPFDVVDRLTIVEAMAILTEQRSEPKLEPAVVLGNFGDKPRIRGKEVSRLSKPRFDVIEALLNDWPKRLSKDELIAVSGHQDAVNILTRLNRHTKHTEWASVIELARERCVGYGIARY